MAAHLTAPGLLQEAMNLFSSIGSISGAASAANVPRNTMDCRIREAKRRGFTAGKAIDDLHNPVFLQSRIKRLESELKIAGRERLEHDMVKRKILKLEDRVADAKTPLWVTTPKKGSNRPGVPTLMLSDLHFGEVVDPTQVGGVNTYNLRIARERIRTVTTGTSHLLSIISPQFEYPGIVIALGGDLVNGNLREEMTATNDENIMPVVIELFETIGSMIETMVEKFGKVFLPCVAGNHGRSTIKTWSSDRHATSFEWLLYCLLAKRFAGDSRIAFHIPNGVDANYRIYNHRFCLSHGDAFRGGDGVIGVLGPVVRGDYKKRARNSQINQSYDTLLIGHFHQYVHLTKLIINGSLVGYNEYAYINNFPYEKPCQALFLTHPDHGMTFRMPVFASNEEAIASTPWVSVK